METYWIPAEKSKEFALAIKASVPMDEIRKACSIQQDSSIVYYAKSEAEKIVCRQFGIQQ